MPKASALDGGAGMENSRLSQPGEVSPLQFGGMNHLAILVAAVVAFVIGAVYYGLMGKRWMKAARVDPSASGASMAGLFATSFVLELVLAWVTAGVIGHLGPGQVTLYNGLVSALFIWFGFIFTTMAIGHRYQGFGWDLTLIDGLHWLLVMLGIGATIGLFGA